MQLLSSGCWSVPLAYDGVPRGTALQRILLVEAVAGPAPQRILLVGVGLGIRCALAVAATECYRIDW